MAVDVSASVVTSDSSAIIDSNESSTRIRPTMIRRYARASLDTALMFIKGLWSTSQTVTAVLLYYMSNTIHTLCGQIVLQQAIIHSARVKMTKARLLSDGNWRIDLPRTGTRSKALNIAPASMSRRGEVTSKLLLSIVGSLTTLVKVY